MAKPWSGRFRQKTSGTVEDFTESISFDYRLWKYDIEGSIAHARMLGKQKIISQDDARNIVKALGEIAGEFERGRFRFRKEYEDIHMNIEAALVARIGDAGGKLHTARSRNDQVALDMRMYVREETNRIAGLLREFQRILLQRAEEQKDTLMPGYTHLQRAQPVMLSHHLIAYIEMLERDRGRLLDSLKRTNILPLGSCALAGTTLPIDRKYVAQLLGFDSVSQNSIDAVSDRDFAIEFVSCLCTLMMHLSRLSEELVLWATEEFSFIELPDSLATGSSIMPQKKNPDVPELVRGKTGRAYGNLTALLTILKGLPLAYNRDLQEDKPPVFDTVDTAKACLEIMCELLKGIKFKALRMKETAGESFSTATDIAEYLVGKGLPFRKAHEVTGKIVAHCLSKRKKLHELTLTEFASFSSLIKKDIYRHLDALSSADSRKSEGGTSRKIVGAQIRRLKRLLSR